MKGENLRRLLFVLMLVPSFAMLRVAQAQTTKVYVDPDVSTANPSESFTINVNVADVVDLFSWAMKLRWDPSILECTKVDEGPFLKGQPAGTVFVARIYAGYIDVGCTTLGDIQELVEAEP